MTSEQIFRAMREIDVKFILDAAPDKPVKKAISWQKWITVAACFCLIVIGAIGYYNVVLRGASAADPEADKYHDRYVYGKVTSEHIDYSRSEMTLEELSQHANEVVIAEYKGGVIENGKCILNFTVTERRKGSGTDADLRLPYLPSSDEVHNGFVVSPFEKGRSYVLLLEKKQPTAYDKDGLYSFVSSRLIIPYDNILEATLYGEEIANPQADGLQLNLDASAEYLISHILVWSQGVPDVEASDITYIPSDDLSEIIFGSEYVLKVRIGDGKYDLDDRITHTCTVEAEYRSAAEISGEIEVLFPKDAVAQGDTVILIVNKFPSTEKSFYLTSEHGIIDISQEDIILEIINSKGE